MATNKPPLLVLLGAGATVPGIPGVASITEDLLAWRAFLSPAEDGSIIPKGNCEDENRLPFFRYLHDQLPRHEAGYNFEQLIGCCEALSHALDDHIEAETGWDGSAYLRSPYAPFMQSKGKLNSGSELWRAHEEARYFVLDRVSRACDHTSGNTPLAKGLSQLADLFTLKVASLNYDDIPLQTNIPFQDGYKRYFDGFVPSSLYSEPSRHVLLHLHGSVRFGPDVRGQAIIPRYESRDEARSNWEVGRAEFGSTPDGYTRYSLPMITGFRKPEAIIWEPYGTYQAAFRYFASTIRTWLVIGYGGGDSHVNAVLQSAVLDAVFNSWYDNRPLRVAVIDYCACDTACLLDLDVNNPIGKLVISRLASKWANTDFQAPESYPFLRSGNLFRPRTFNRLTKRLWLSADGTGWALTEGMSQLADVLLGTTADA